MTGTYRTVVLNQECYIAVACGPGGLRPDVAGGDYLSHSGLAHSICDSHVAAPLLVENEYRGKDLCRPAPKDIRLKARRYRMVLAPAMARALWRWRANQSKIR